MAKILSSEDIEEIREDISMIKDGIESYQQNIDILIKSFDSEDIVQNFYTVGNFGKEQQEKIIKIRESVNEFYTLICKEGGLVQKTNEFLDNASALNKTGTM